MVEHLRTEFRSGGIACLGHLYRAEGSTGRGPCVVMAHGFGGTQEGSLAATASDYAAAGFHAFTFDYRRFGESGGEPRQLVVIEDQHEDWRSAIAFVRGLPDVDPDKVALWGSSLGGGHVIHVAAGDPNVAAVVAQVPFTFGFPNQVEGRKPGDAWRLLAAALKDWWRGITGKPPHYILGVGLPGELAVMASPEAVRVVESMENRTWRNEIAPRILLELAFWYRPGKRAKHVTCPLLITLAELDMETPTSMTRRVAAIAPRGELRRYPCAHFDFYQPSVRRVIAADQISFLRTHLLGLQTD